MYAIRYPYMYMLQVYDIAEYLWYGHTTYDAQRGIKPSMILLRHRADFPPTLDIIHTPTRTQ
jgi:hypothetical protein